MQVTVLLTIDDEEFEGALLLDDIEEAVAEEIETSTSYRVESVIVEEEEDEESE